MTPEMEEDLLAKVNKIFIRLVQLGCHSGPWLSRGSVALTFAHTDRGIARRTPKGMRLTVEQTLEFAQLIRQATLYERSGILIADIDRMGKVVGWHTKGKTT